jgi:hypothetical protein
VAPLAAVHELVSNEVELVSWAGELVSKAAELRNSG